MLNKKLSNLLMVCMLFIQCYNYRIHSFKASRDLLISAPSILNGIKFRLNMYKFKLFFKKLEKKQSITLFIYFNQ